MASDPFQSIRKSLNYAIAKLQGMYSTDLLVIFLTGSHVDGTSNLQSDIDLVVINKSDRCERIRFVACSREVDVFVETPQSVEAALSSATVRHKIWKLSHCEPVFDPRGLGIALRSRANDIWRKGRRPLPARLLDRQRAEVADYLRTLMSADENDVVSFNYLVGTCTERFLEIYWVQHGLWGSHRKSALKLLQGTSVKLYHDFEILLDQKHAVATRKKSAQVIAEYVFL